MTSNQAPPPPIPKARSGPGIPDRFKDFRRRNGRPTKYTAKLRDAIAETVRNAGVNPIVAARAHGVSEEGHAQWMATRADYSSAILGAEATTEAEQARTVVQAGALGEWRAAAHWLERRRPGDWGKREYLAIDHRQIKALPDDQLMRLIPSALKALGIDATALPGAMPPDPDA